MPVLGGGNLDMTMLQTNLIHALTERGQILRLRVRIDDMPGKMDDILGIIAEYGANIQTGRHDRAVEDLTVGEAYLVFQIETSGAEHAATIIEAIEAEGYVVEDVNRK